MGNRALTQSERSLARWMLENGSAEAAAFLSQLDNAEVTPWRCPCGCASLKFKIKGMSDAPPRVHILGEFVFGKDETFSGIFIFSSAGILSGIEVYGLAGDAPPQLPDPKELRPFGSNPAGSEGAARAPTEEGKK